MVEGLELKCDSDMIRSAPVDITDIDANLDHKNAGALLISGTASRSPGVNDDFEQRLCMSVSASNLAMICGTLRSVRIDERKENYGKLLRDD